MIDIVRRVPRAVYHFLTDPDDRARYRRNLAAGLAEDGHVVIGTFAQDGPQSCSGLPVARYSPDTLAEQFAGFDVVAAEREEHHTPASRMQPFTLVAAWFPAWTTRYGLTVAPSTYRCPTRRASPGFPGR